MYYNLLVSGDDGEWQGKDFRVDRFRVLEYTQESIKKDFYDLNELQINEIKKLPCIFAYESACKKNPKFGYIKDIFIGEEVEIEYEILGVKDFLTYEQLEKYASDFDIKNYELYRTHYAIKKVNLQRVLWRMEVFLPLSTLHNNKSIDIIKHNFDVALTFSGKERNLINIIAHQLQEKLGINSVFYDKFYISQLARPELDILLQDIYLNRSNLIVAFLSENYKEKEWCNLEFKVIREIIKKRQLERIMYIKMDDVNIDGVFSTDGYIDARVHSTEKIVSCIEERIKSYKLKGY